MFWSGQTWLNRGLEVVRHSFDAKNIDCAAYKLSVGDQYFITPKPGENLAQVGIRRLRSYNPQRPWNSLHEKDSFSIPPGQFAYIITKEEVTIPQECLGFISLSTGFKFGGLINVSGFHVDPGYKGRLIYAVFNAGPNNVTIEYGQKLFPLWIAQTDSGGDYTFKKDGIKNIDANFVNKINSPIYSVQDFSSRIRKIEVIMTTLWYAFLFSTTIASVIGVYLAFFNGRE